VLVCTNSYFVLAVRFIKKFLYHYKVNSSIKFYLFTDADPTPFLPNVNFEYYPTNHQCWRDATNSKFSNILLLDSSDCEYLFYFDADTNVGTSFDEGWFLGDLVGGEHYGNSSYMVANKDKPFERNPKSKAYVPIESPLQQTYCYGAFFGGKKQNMLDLCKALRENQLADQEIKFEPCWNDESYINHYFHFYPPKIIPSKNFPFLVSDKGGIGETRNTNLNVNDLKNKILEHSTKTFDIANNNIVLFKD
jgi:hypothetical protein